MKNLKTLLAICLLGGFGFNARAADLGYSYENLNQFWQRIADPVDHYNDIGTAEVIAEKQAATAASSSRECRPDPRRPCKQQPQGDVKKGSDVLRITFDIIRPASEVAENVYSRQALLDLYLAKDRKFNFIYLSPQENQTLDTNARNQLKVNRIAEMRQRMMSASLELYLMRLVRYYADEDIGNKCLAVKGADALYQSAIKGLDPAKDLLPVWTTLYNRYLGTIQRFQSSPDHTLACEVTPIKSRAQATSLVNQIVTDQVTVKLKESVAETVDLIRVAGHAGNCDEILANLQGSSGSASQASALQKLNCIREKVDSISLPIDETMALARDVKNVKSNLDLIVAGKSGVQSLQRQLFAEAGMNDLGHPLPGKAPFPKLKDAKNLHQSTFELQSANNSILGQGKGATRTKGSLAAAVGYLNELGKALVPTSGIAACQEAATLEAALDPNSQKSSTDFVEKVNVCLNQTIDQIKIKIVPNIDDKIRDQFAKDLQKISDDVLARTLPMQWN